MWYWHVKADDYADDGDDGRSGSPVRWGTVRRLIVIDEPLVFEGWTVRAQRLRAQGRCRSRLRVSGTFAFADNSDRPTARFSIRLLSRGATVARLRGDISEFDRTYDEVVCLRRSTPRQLTAVAAVRDPGAHVVEGVRRAVTIRR